jgi:hypothetical protein
VRVQAELFREFRKDFVIPSAARIGRPAVRVGDLPLVNPTGCEDSTGQHDRGEAAVESRASIPAVDGKILTLAAAYIPTNNGNMSQVLGAANRESSLPASTDAAGH